MHVCTRRAPRREQETGVKKASKFGGHSERRVTCGDGARVPAGPSSRARQAVQQPHLLHIGHLSATTSRHATSPSSWTSSGHHTCPATGGPLSSHCTSRRAPSQRLLPGTRPAARTRHPRPRLCSPAASPVRTPVPQASPLVSRTSSVPEKPSPT